MSGPVPRGDTDPAEWSDHVATYDLVADRYAATFLHELAHKPFDRALLARFAEVVGRRACPSTPVCDLGCGPGHIGAFVAEHGVEVVGIDLSPGMVAEARRSFPSLTFSVGDMTALPYEDRSLAGIVCFYALIHLPRARVPLALREMHRVLVAGGDLLLAVHGGEGTLHAPRMLDRPASIDATLFTPTELGELAQAAGFAVVESHERAPYESEVATQRIYVWARRER